jgi:hypothetical protein
MLSLFQTPRWDRLAIPKNLELSQQAEQVQSAVQQTPLFQQGFRVVPGAKRQVSLQNLGTPISTGPSLVGSPGKLTATSGATGERKALLTALKGTQKGFQFGPSGSLASSQTPKGFAKPAVTTGFNPPSADKPMLSGGIPLVPHSPIPGLEVEADDVQFGGFNISGTGEVSAMEPPAPALGATPSLAPDDFLEEPALGAEVLDELDPRRVRATVQSKTLTPPAPAATSGGVSGLAALPSISIVPPVVAPVASPPSGAPITQPTQRPPILGNVFTLTPPSVAEAPMSATAAADQRTIDRIISQFNSGMALSGRSRARLREAGFIITREGVVVEDAGFGEESGGGSAGGGAGDDGGDTGGDDGSGDDSGGDDGGDDGGGDDGGGDDGGDF